VTVQSFERNLALGIASPYLDVCLPAALEQLSEEYSYRPKVYRDRIEFVNWWANLSRPQTFEYIDQYENHMTRLVRPLGGLSCQDLTFSTATTPLGWTRIVNRHFREDRRVAVDIRIGRNRLTSHTVGLIPTEEEGFVRLKSSYLPRGLGGVVPLSRVAERMYVSPDVIEKRYPKHIFENSNIISLPPE